jgi:hypothetical protein
MAPDNGTQLALDFRQANQMISTAHEDLGSIPEDVEAELPGRPLDGVPSVVFRIGARFTSVARSNGDRVLASRIVSHAPVLLAASQAAAASASGSATARVIRSAAQQVVERKQLQSIWRTGNRVLGAAGVARALVTLSAAGGSKATLDQIRQATNKLGAVWVDEKKENPSQSWSEPMMVGAAMLEALLESLGASEIEVEPPVPRAAG